MENNSLGYHVFETLKGRFRGEGEYWYMKPEGDQSTLYRESEEKNEEESSSVSGENIGY